MRVRSGDVFLNVPFSDSHEAIFLALIAGLTALRLNPRCVLEVPPQQNRLDRLFALISSCAYSIHDLSCVQLSSGTGHRVPRFNMPFELGLAVAVALARPGKGSHQFRILEAEPYRLQKSLSDVLGFDPYIHRGRADGTLEALLNVFNNLPGAPDLGELRRLNQLLRQYRKGQLGQDVFQAKAFSKLVVAARALAR